MTGKIQKDIAQAKALLNEGRLQESLNLIHIVNEEMNRTESDIIECGILETRIRLEQGNLKLAFDLINKIIQGTDNLEYPLLVSKMQSLKAEICWKSGKLEASLDAIEEGREILERMTKEKESAEIRLLDGMFLRHLGIIHWYKGDLENATDYHMKSMNVFEELNDRKGIGISLNNLGLVYWSKGDLENAREYYEKSLKIGEELENKHQISVILNNLGNVCAMKGDNTQALEYYQRALQTRKELGNKQDIALTLTNIGAANEALGNLEVASQYYQQSLEIYEELDIDHGIALALNNLSSLYQLRGELDLALDYLERSLVIREKLDNIQDVAQSLINLGELHRIKGEPEKALKTYQQCLTTYENIGNDPYLSIVLFKLVCITLELKHIVLTEEYLRRLEQIDEKTKNKAIHQRYSLANALFHKSKKRIRDKLKAQEILEEIANGEIIDHSLTILAMIHLCELLLTELRMTEEEDVFGEVKDLTNKLMEIAKQQSSHLLLVETYILQSKLALIEFDIENAMILLTKAEDIANTRGLALLSQRIKHEHDVLTIQMQKWEDIIEREPSRKDMIDLALVENLVDRMIRKTVSSLSENEKKQIIENISRRRYNLIHSEHTVEIGRGEKSTFRVGIAQIGLSQHGDILHEFYEKKDSGLFGLKQDKVQPLLLKVEGMIELANRNGVNLLLFPELSIDLNYSSLFETVIQNAQKYQMHIIPGSFHDDKSRRNLCRIIGPSGVLWEQEKHIPATIHYEGQKLIEEIDVKQPAKNIIIANTEYGRIAVVICRDFLDMDLRVELKNSDPPVDLIINPAFTPVTADFKAAHFDARRSIYAYCFFVNIAEFGDSLIYSPEKERAERTIPPQEENLIYKDVNLFQLRSERKRWESEQKKQISFIQSTR